MKKILSILLVFLTTVFLVSCQNEIHTIYFDVNGGTPQVTKQEVKNKGFANHPEQEVTKDGYSFAYWYDSETEDQFLFEITKVTKDYVLVAYWNELPGNGGDVDEDEVTITFNLDNEVTRETVKKGTTVTKPENPIKEGFEFLGWYTDSAGLNIFDFTQEITDDLIIYGKWKSTSPDIIEYTVTYETNGGSTVADSKVYDGKKLEKPNNPFRSGFIFDGWYLDTQLTDRYDFDKIVKGDFKLYAKWREREQGELHSYYQGRGIEDMVGDELRSALNKRLNDGVKIAGYGGNLNPALIDADKHPTKPGYVYTIYDGEAMKDSASGSSGPNEWNKEHVMPQSWYVPKEGRKGDLHNLRISRASINSTRSNLSFAQGTGNWSKVSGGFYPGNGHQGDVARIAMYMLTTLPNTIKVDKAFAGSKPIQTMLKWHLEDPVDAFEIRRNEVLFGYQKNRNPFIDHPEFAELIWGGMTTNLTNQKKLSNLLNAINLVTDIVINIEVYVPNKRYEF